MLQRSHENAASVLDELAKRSPQLATALDVVGPIRCVGEPEVITDQLIERLKTVLGVEPTDPKHDFRRGARFEVSQGFPVDIHRETLAPIIQEVIDGKGEVLTRANISY